MSKERGRREEKGKEGRNELQHEKKPAQSGTVSQIRRWKRGLQEKLKQRQGMRGGMEKRR